MMFPRGSSLCGMFFPADQARHFVALNLHSLGGVSYWIFGRLDGSGEHP